MELSPTQNYWIGWVLWTIGAFVVEAIVLYLVVTRPIVAALASLK